jgi:hypothetical protein
MKAVTATRKTGVTRMNHKPAPAAFLGHILAVEPAAKVGSVVAKRFKETNS